MQSESLPGRVLPLPLRSIDSGFSIADELARARRLMPAGGAARRSLTSPPDLRVDLIAFDEGASIERPWRAGRLVLQCLDGYVHVVTADGTRDLVEGEILCAEARRIRRIEAREAGAVMATIVTADQLSRSCHAMVSRNELSASASTLWGNSL